MWNTGIIVVKNKVLKNLFLNFSKLLYKNSVLACNNSFRENEFIILDKRPLEKIKEVSVDFEILEKSFQKLVIPYTGQWSDLGTYDSLHRVKKSLGNVISFKSENNFTYSDKKLLVVAGVKNLVIVNTKNAILVTKKSSSILLRNIMKKLVKKKYS